MKKVPSLALACALAFTGLVAACGGGGNAGTGGHGTGGHGTTSSAKATTSATTGTGGGPTAMEACNASALARCGRLDACSKGALITQRYGTMAACVSRQEASCNAGLAAPDTGSTPATVEACAAALPAESCEELLDNNPTTACAAASGARAEGAACAFGAQCQTAFCLVSSGQICGTCANKPADGAPCVTTTQCGYNQACPKTGTCATYVELNGACGAGVSCAAGLTCHSVCEAEVAVAGAACDQTDKTAPLCDRNLGLYCDATSQQCQLIAYHNGGAPCDPTGAPALLCAAGGLCVAATSTCSDAAADGAACDDTSGPPCLSPAHCVGGVCKVSDGASCN